MSKTAKEVAQEITSKWKTDIGLVITYERMQADIEKALRDRDERAAQIADAVENEWLENARNVARADNLVGGLAQSTYTSYAEVAGKIASAIREQ